MKAFYKIREILCEMLEESAKEKKLSSSSLEYVHKITDTIKNIDKILMLEEEGSHSQDGYSQAGHWRADIRGGYGDEHSYRRRDSMGRYSRDGGSSYDGGGTSHNGGGYSQRGYSRDGYSQASAHIMRELQALLDKAESNIERETIRNCIEDLKNA